MNTIRKSIVIGMSVLAMGATALTVQAQSPAPVQEGRHGSAASHEQHKAKAQARRATRVARLHDALKLNAAQEPAWAAYQAALKSDAKGMRGERKAWAGLSAPARMEKRIAMARQHTAAMETRLAALNTFYASLSPEQQKLFDENSMKGGMHGKRGHRMKGMMQG